MITLAVICVVSIVLLLAIGYILGYQRANDKIMDDIKRNFDTGTDNIYNDKTIDNA